jgi:hypothetical protein
MAFAEPVSMKMIWNTSLKFSQRQEAQKKDADNFSGLL